MKKLFKISAMVLASGIAVTLAGCGGCTGCSSCGGSSKSLTLTDSNWYTSTSYKGIQPSFITEDTNYADYAEKISYSFSFSKPSSGNSAYSLDYKDGSLTTQFNAKYYDWNTSIEPYKKQVKELVYYYRAELTVKVKYSFASGNTDYGDDGWFDEDGWTTDHILNECYFRPAGKNLQPVYSKQTIRSTDPASYNATNINTACKKVDAVYENYYNYNCTEVTSVEKDRQGKILNESKVKLSGSNYSVFDVSSVYIAARSMKLGTADLSQTVSLYSAAAGGYSSYNFAVRNSDLGKTERAKVSEELAKQGLYAPVTVDDKGNAVEDAGVKSVAVDIKYTGGPLEGTTQSIWYAAISNPDRNTARATMLKISIPLSYNLGTLNFTLDNIESTLWNG